MQTFLTYFNKNEDVQINTVFEYFICQLQNKEYLIAVYKHRLLSRKEFLSKHFAVNCMSV